MFSIYNRITVESNEILRQGAASRLTDEEFILNEIKAFKLSKRRRAMLDGERYYRGEHDILKRERTVIGRDGELETVNNLPNNRIIDNQYRKMVLQKCNYLLGQPFVVKADNDESYIKTLSRIFNKRFMRTMKDIGRDSINCGIGWLFAHYDEQGKLAFKRLSPQQIIPGWRDEAHTVLDYAIRVYEVEAYTGKEAQILEKVEIFDESGIHRYIHRDGKLMPDDNPHEPYFTLTETDGTETPYNWSNIPLIPFKYNADEIPLINNVRSLQDGINLILSLFQNNMEEDAHNTIIVLVNYDGTDLGEFRHDLATHGAVKVSSYDGANGDVRTLRVEVNADNYKAILEIFKKAIIENALGYDAKDDRLSGNPNQMNIQSMYSDIDLDANGMETEYQAAFEVLLWFIDAYLSNPLPDDDVRGEVEIIFNRDMLMNESEIITNIRNSVGILSDETLTAQHPWTDNPQEEIERKAKEKQEAIDEYSGTFPPAGNVLNGGGADER